MKKVIIFGCGAQGSAIAKHLDVNPNVNELILADYSKRAAEELSASLKKAKGMQIDANDIESLKAAAKGCSLIVNGLPLQYNLKVMETAISVGSDYMDMAAPMEDCGYVETYKMMLGEWAEKFKKAKLTALIACGSSPGLASVMTRELTEKFDSVDKIGIYVYEGLVTNKFVPFWWSPEVALGDMAYDTFRVENGKIISDIPFSRPEMMRFKGINRELRLVDHEHDEPVSMGLCAKEYLKGAKNIEFKYGGPHIELSELFYKFGLLSKEPFKIGNTSVVPLDLVIKMCPPAPKFEDEIQQIIKEGIIAEEGVFCVRVEGKIGGETVKKDSYVNAPGLVESFKKAKMSHESYLTGQAGAIFVKMMVDGHLTDKGLLVPEMLGEKARNYIFTEFKKIGVTFDEITEKPLA